MGLDGLWRAWVPVASVTWYDAEGPWATWTWPHPQGSGTDILTVSTARPWLFYTQGGFFFGLSLQHV